MYGLDPKRDRIKKKILKTDLKIFVHITKFWLSQAVCGFESILTLLMREDTFQVSDRGAIGARETFIVECEAERARKKGEGEKYRR